MINRDPLQPYAPGVLARALAKAFALLLIGAAATVAACAHVKPSWGERAP